MISHTVLQPASPLKLIHLTQNDGFSQKPTNKDVVSDQKKKKGAMEQQTSYFLESRRKRVDAKSNDSVFIDY